MGRSLGVSFSVRSHGSVWRKALPPSTDHPEIVELSPHLTSPSLIHPWCSREDLGTPGLNALREFAARNYHQSLHARTLSSAPTPTTSRHHDITTSPYML